jgi:hypothetical protein
MGRQQLKSLAVNTYCNHGDALEGEQVIAQARKVGKTRVVSGTSTHQIQETILRRNVLCVIDRPFRLAGGPMRIKETPFK